MTIQDETLRIAHDGDGATVAFAFPMPIRDTGDIAVYLQATESDPVLQVEGSGADYTVTLAGEPDGDDGGTVTFNSAPPSAQDVIIILDPPLTQLSSLPFGGAFPSEAVERELDKQLNIAKRTRDIVSRAPVLIEGDSDGSGRYDANTNRIVNLADPTADQDAATAAYVDAQVAAATLDPATPVSAFMATVLDDTSGDSALDTLGAGSKGIAILKDTTSAAVLTELGVTAFMRTRLAQDDNATELRTAISAALSTEIPGENLIRANPNFEVWQHGTTVDGSTTPANNDDTYVCDQTILLSDGNDRVDVAKDVADVPSVARCSIQLTAQAANQFGILVPLTSEETIRLRGGAVSASVYFKSALGNTSTLMRMALLEWTGTADAITSDVVATYNGLAAAPTYATNWASLGEATLTGIADTWLRYFLADVDVGATANNLAVFVYTFDATLAIGDIFNLSGLKLELGDAVTAYRQPSYADAWTECQRFFTKTFEAETAPGHNAGVDGALHDEGRHNEGTASATSAVVENWRFPVPMYSTPTISTYNPGNAAPAAGEDWRNVTDGKDLAVNQLGASTRGVTLHGDGADQNDIHAIHATADARL